MNVQCSDRRRPAQAVRLDVGSATGAGGTTTGLGAAAGGFVGDDDDGTRGGSRGVRISMGPRRLGREPARNWPRTIHQPARAWPGAGVAEAGGRISTQVAGATQRH